jgi:HlyD family secretion protein
MTIPATVPQGGQLALSNSWLIPVEVAEKPQVDGILKTAYIALAVFSAIFIIWAAAAPLSSAAIAQGVLRADGGGRKTVQHLEGGIIKKILVREGQKVKAGQVIVLLDETQSAARDAALQTTYDNLVAQDARLTAEREGRASVTYPKELLERAKSDPAVAQVIRASDAVFRTRRQALSDQMAIMRQRLGQASAELSSTGAQLQALREQSQLLADEETGVSKLVEEGLERRSRLLALQRQQAQTLGQQGQLQGNAARIRDAAAETRAQMSFLYGQQATDAAAQQRDVQASLAEVTEKLNVSRDISKRRQIIAPVDGTIVNLRMVTPTGVITPGQPILDIVPSNEKIVILARLKANDIDVVHENQVAEVRLTPYKARTVPLLKGRVRSVSPDASIDEQSGTLYYEAQIELDPRELKELPNVRLLSGMPAEVFINLGERSLFQYMVQPFIDSFRRAFRED